MKIPIKQSVLVGLLGFFLISCEDFLEIETPNHTIVSEAVFEYDETALSAMAGIYNQLSSISFSSGGPASVTVLAGLSGDNLISIQETNLPYQEIDQHEILPDNFRNLDLWSSAYSIIYLTNSLLEGVENSDDLTVEIEARLQGEAKFIRAFTYFYLVNLYGEIPLVLTTDYQSNALLPRTAEEEIYEQILGDLTDAVNLLQPEYFQGERTSVNKYAAQAMLARVQLFFGNWQEAENVSSQVIVGNSLYDILENLNEVFLANSREALWQLSPIGRGNNLINTNEGAFFIIDPLGTFSEVKLADNFVASFSSEDKRLSNWIAYHQEAESYYPFKYKVRNSTGPISEYSMVLRLAEQYFIRAEARAMQGNISGAIKDLDIIRERAGLELIAETRPDISQEDLLELIQAEKNKEFFTEWGHRWLDLKRTGKAAAIMAPGSSFWEDTDVLYPIPEADRLKNPNLTQNDGY